MTDDDATEAGYWVGGYTSDANGHARGIARLVPSEAGGLRLAGPEHPWNSPSFLAWHPWLPIVYSADEVAGTVTAHRVESLAPVALTAVVSQPAGPLVCHVAVSPGAGHLAAACWGDGAVLVYPLGDDGMPGAPLSVAPAVDPHPEARRATPPPFGLEPGSRAHFVHWLSPSRFVVTDLGFDLLREIDLLDGAPVVRSSTPLPFGSGPRHLVALDGGALVVVMEYSCEAVVLEPADGGYRVVQRLALREGGPRPGDTAAHLCTSADGSLLYAGVRGSDVIAVLRRSAPLGEVSPDGEVRPGGEVSPGGELVRVGEFASGGSIPRHHAVDGSLLHIAHQGSDEITTHALDPATGLSAGVTQRLPLGTPSMLLPTT
ncbi:beta-propeller fold lactonase family protein [Herbiconiux sp. KACC 21604]|uniref:lactonase family protein n=1 Tax=unclassified Herbiconiux TaxID=2618217 RepID=UPI001491536C|nr:beta-propeller fold lactonase family protein [Herbiconiux sp. SALV-R1]QJU55014.1 beta-propeller fold lactonase family protein [Herbiconiux sp. SALV-R1]WPO86149.1 beta-propeller fold lactonase family protein [Herbiconiux sp. KACC 21604]